MLVTGDEPITPAQRLALERLRGEGEWRPAILAVYLPASSEHAAKLIMPDGRIFAA